MRKYDAKEVFLGQEVAKSEKVPSLMPSWTFPLFGFVALISIVSLLAVVTRRASKSTRHVQVVQPVLQSEFDGEPLLDEAAVDE